MKKRILSVLLVLVMVVSLVPTAALASTAYYINGKYVHWDDYSSSESECWAYAQNFYTKIWGTNFSSYRGTSDDSLRDLSKSEHALTADNLKAYVSNASLGASLRICNDEYYDSSDGWGHSQIIVQKDSNGFTVFEGGLTASPHCREKYYTWSEYVSTGWLGGTYSYIKYIKWPGAEAYSTAGEDNPTGTVTYAVTGGSITFDKSTGTITDCDTSVTAANIPSKIDGVAVTGIGARAFYQCTSLTSVTIPNSVTYIIHSAFSGCTSLTSITIPDSVTGISWSAFYGCTSLTDVYYLGSAEQWNAISIGTDNDPLTSANIHYNYHVHNYTAAVTAPTCTAQGYTTYTCTCGDSYVGSYTNALGHSYANGVCDRCGAAEPKSEDGSIIVSTAKARAGSNVTVDISLKDNPGVSAITLAIDYDTDKLELVSSEDGGLTGWFVAKKAVWTSSGADSSYNGVILSLTFKVKEGVEDGTIPVTVSYSSGDIGNNDEESLFPSVVAGGVTVFSVLPGDINGDGNVNSLDLIRLKKYIADDTTALVGSGDVNGDGNVNSLDLIRLKKYIAGSDVELF